MTKVTGFRRKILRIFSHVLMVSARQTTEAIHLLTHQVSMRPYFNIPLTTTDKTSLHSCFRFPFHLGIRLKLLMCLSPHDLKKGFRQFQRQRVFMVNFLFIHPYWLKCSFRFLSSLEIELKTIDNFL